MRCTITSAAPVRGTTLVAAPRRADAAAPARRLRAPILPSPSQSRSATTSTSSTSSSYSLASSLRLLPAAASGAENGGNTSRYRVVPCASASSSAGAAGESSSGGENEGSKPSSSFSSKIKSFFGGGEKLDRERLKALGTGFVASYGLISNISYGGGMAVAWVAFVKKFGTSPLASGEWKHFLLFFSAFWMTQNFVRPLRFSLALALAPSFDRFIDFLEAKLRISRPRAFGVYIALLGITTSTLVFGGIFLACGPAAYAR